MHGINKIEISGFKTIRQADIPLRPLNLLIGPNGAGKSNLLSIFTLLYHAMDGRLQSHTTQQGGADALLHYGAKRTSKISIRIDLGSAVYAVDLEAAAGDTLVVSEERLACQVRGVMLPELRLGGGRKELLLALHGHAETDWQRFLHGIRSDPGFTQRALGEQAGLPAVVQAAAQADPGFLQKLLPPFALLNQPVERIVPLLKETVDVVKAACLAFRVYHFQDTSASAPIKQQGDLHDNRQLRQGGGNLAAFLYQLRVNHPGHYDKIRDTIRLVAPFFDDFRLAPLVLNPQRIQLEWAERGSDKYFNASYLPDGLLRFMCLATLLLQPEPPPLIVIDEPELGLHPYAIGVLSGLLRAASHQSQVVAATHSITLLDEIEDIAEVLICERIQGESSFRRPDPDQLGPWLEDYSLSEIWQKNVPGFGGRPRP